MYPGEIEPRTRRLSLPLSAYAEVLFVKYGDQEAEAVQVGSSIQVDSEIFFGRDFKIYLVDFHQRAVKVHRERYTTPLMCRIRSGVTLEKIPIG